MTSSALLRSSGVALVIGGVLSFESYSGVLGFLMISLSPFTGSLVVMLDLLLGNFGWLLLAGGLLALGVHLFRELAADDRTPKLLAALGAGWAAVSVVASLAGLVALMIAPGRTPGFLRVALEGTVPFLVFGGLVIASVTLGTVLLYTRQLGRWWVLLLVLGILTVPRVLGLVVWIYSIPVTGNSSNLSLALNLLPYALFAAGWMLLGLLVAFRTRGRSPARVV